MIVSNFTGIPISSTSIYLIWALPIGYTAQYYLVNVDELETNHSWTFHAVESRANIISLHPYYTYRCSVAVVLNETYPYSGYIFVTTHPSGKNYFFLAFLLFCNSTHWSRTVSYSKPNFVF